MWAGTDFSSTKDKDWEEVRLKRELTDLEAKISEAETAAEKRRNRDKYGSGGSTAPLVKRELEQMLEYKRRTLRDLEEGKSQSKGGTSLKSVRDDLDMVREQVDTLEQYLKEREAVLQGLYQEVGEEKGRRWCVTVYCADSRVMETFFLCFWFPPPIVFSSVLYFLFFPSEEDGFLLKSKHFVRVINAG